MCHKTKPTQIKLTGTITQSKGWPKSSSGCLRDIIVKALDCGMVVSEFERQSSDYVRFRTNNLGKIMNPLILPAMGVE